ncbi:unnamed protein product, partial [Cladocopium goreaui]
AGWLVLFAFKFCWWFEQAASRQKGAKMLLGGSHHPNWSVMEVGSLTDFLHSIQFPDLLGRADDFQCLGMTGQWIMSRQDRQLASVDHGSGLASEAHGTRPSGLRREKDLDLEPGRLVAQFGKSQTERWLEAFHGVPFAAIPIPEDSGACKMSSMMMIGLPRRSSTSEGALRDAAAKSQLPEEMQPAMRWILTQPTRAIPYGRSSLTTEIFFQSIGLGET